MSKLFRTVQIAEIKTGNQMDTAGDQTKGLAMVGDKSFAFGNIIQAGKRTVDPFKVPPGIQAMKIAGQNIHFHRTDKIV